MIVLFPHPIPGGLLVLRVVKYSSFGPQHHRFKANADAQS